MYSVVLGPYGNAFIGTKLNRFFNILTITVAIFVDTYWEYFALGSFACDMCRLKR